MSLECGECERDRRGPHDWDCSRNNPRRVRIKEGWGGAGQEGVILGANVDVEQLWTPVLWDDEEDPDWHKTAGLEFKTPNMPLDIDITGQEGSVDVEVDHKSKKVSLSWQVGDRVRITRFPMFLVGNLCSVLLREARVSTFRFSMKTNRHQISVPRDMDARDVAML